MDYLKKKTVVMFVLAVVEAIDTDHEFTVKHWEEGLEAEALKKISVMGLMGKRSDSVVQIKDSLASAPGDRIRFGLRMQQLRAPMTTGNQVETNEQKLSKRYDEIFIDEFVDAYRFENVMTRQRITYENRDEGKAALSDQLSYAYDVSFFNQVCGVAAVGGAPTWEGHNAIVAPDSSHRIITSFDGTEANLATTDTFNLDLISRAVLLARLATPSIRPANIPGFSTPMYAVFLHPYQVKDMKEADGRWEAVQRDMMRGGVTRDNPLFTGALGVWDGCAIFESPQVPLVGTSTHATLPTTYYRAVLLGAQAAVAAWGRIGGTPQRFRWVEKLFDYDRELGVLGGFCGGIKKTVYKDVSDGTGAAAFDFATVTISTAGNA
jgi:N4-gp56 family major capsid protein